MTFKCCVPGCGENGKRNLHSFPKNEEQCKKWILATWCFNLDKKVAWASHYKVCRKHFQPADFKNWNLLKRDVVPSLMLPHSITMEHDYCTRSSTVMNVNATNVDYEFNTEASAADTNCENLIACEGNFSVDCVMEFEEEVIRIDNWNEVELLSKSEANEREFEEALSEKGTEETTAVGNSAHNEPAHISKEITPANDNRNELCESNISDNRKTESASSAQSEPKQTKKYDPAVRKMRYLSKRNKDLAKKLKEAQSANLKSNKKSKIKKKIDNVLKTLALELPAMHYNFIKLQLKNTGKSKNGNRFTIEEKTLALVIYKQNPKRYKSLLKMANLPTRQTLIAHSALIRFKEGLNQHLMNYIKEVVSQMEPLDKLCTIGWDEMALTANLNFDQVKDYIDGFEDLESKRTDNFATHGLVFMVRGIKSAYKQPVAYFLTENLKAAELAELVKYVIQAVMDTGLKVIGSVCDAVNTNRAAVNKLIFPKSLRANTSGKLLEYTINGEKIWHYFDPPHLIKSVRNNLLVKNLSHNVSFNETKFRPNGAIVWNDKNKQQRTASWAIVSDFYEFNKDCKNGLFNLIPNITQEHINPERRKMKVSLATQVFSGTCGRNMYLCWKRKQFENNCLGTSAILLFFNELFDSVNGDDIPIPGKMNGAVTTTSDHFEFWEYAIRMLDTMKFSENLTTGKSNLSYVCKHFISTVKGLRRICEYLFESGFESVGLRRLSQDGLENQFSKIRSYCGSNPKPNARDFRNAYTTAILNNELTSHSLNANCEADGDHYILQNLHGLFDKKNDLKTGSCSDSNEIGECTEHEQAHGCKGIKHFESVGTVSDELSGMSFAEDEGQNCIAGKICKQLLVKYKCPSCSATITASTNKKDKCLEHEIMRKQSSADEIILPKVEFITCIKNIISKVQQMLPVLCVEKNLMQKLLSGLSFEKNNEELIGCNLHRIEFVKEMKKITSKLTIERFVLGINRILTGKVTTATECIFQKKALEFKKKKKNIGKFVPAVSSNIV